MTNKEAIEVLASHLYHWERLFESRICSKKEGEETIEALKMAIKALEDDQCYQEMQKPKKEAENE